MFDAKATGFFESADGKKISVNNTGTFAILSLFFGKTSLRLKI